LAGTLASSDWSEIKYVFHSVFFFVSTVRVIKLDGNNDDDCVAVTATGPPSSSRSSHAYCMLRTCPSNPMRARCRQPGRVELRSRRKPHKNASVGFFLLGFFLFPPLPPPSSLLHRNTLSKNFNPVLPSSVYNNIILYYYFYYSSNATIYSSSPCVL